MCPGACHRLHKIREVPQAALTCTLLIGQEAQLTLRMTPAMGAIYDAITDLMDACLKELKRSNKVRRACEHVPHYVTC